MDINRSRPQRATNHFEADSSSQPATHGVQYTLRWITHRSTLNEPSRHCWATTVLSTRIPKITRVTVSTCSVRDCLSDAQQAIPGPAKSQAIHDPKLSIGNRTQAFAISTLFSQHLSFYILHRNLNSSSSTEFARILSSKFSKLPNSTHKKLRPL